MPGFYKVKLTKTNSKYGSDFYLNPSSYRYIEPLETHTGVDGSIITFDKGDWVSVVESPEEVFNKIKNAERIL